MGRLNLPPTANPASGGRKGPAGPGGVGNETSTDVHAAQMSTPGPGSKRNTGDENLGFNSSKLHEALP